jgi:hypothetical protein
MKMQFSEFVASASTVVDNARRDDDTLALRMRSDALRQIWEYLKQNPDADKYDIVRDLPPTDGVKLVVGDYVDACAAEPQLWESLDDSE